MKNISILGATGSIGYQSIEIIKNNPDKFKLNAISIGKNINKLHEILSIIKPDLICVKDKHDCETLKTIYPNLKFTYGYDGLLEVATYHSSDILINSLVGSVGLIPTIFAINQGKDIALANKETLVSAGHIVMERALNKKVNILPIDSEHSAIFQCLNGENSKNINRLILTASGGSFRDKTYNELKNVTINEALNHPNWSMGSKITIDSATMVNKGLEIIEAHYLFNVDYDNIHVLLHKESIIHSMVEFNDMSIIAQLGNPDMKIPIQYALTYPNRIKNTDFKPLNLEEISSLNFKKIDFNRYPCVKMAYDSGKIGGTTPTVFNSSNEEAVYLFLNNKISFLDIEKIIYESISNHKNIKSPDLETIIQIDKEIRECIIKKYA